MRTAAGSVAVVGIAALVWGAAPVYWDGLVEEGVAGHSIQHWVVRWPSVPLLVAVSLVPWWLIGIFASRWSDADHEPMPSSRLFEVCLAWLLYVGIAYLLFRIISGGAPLLPGRLSTALRARRE